MTSYINTIKSHLGSSIPLSNIMLSCMMIINHPAPKLCGKGFYLKIVLNPVSPRVFIMLGKKLPMNFLVAKNSIFDVANRNIGIFVQGFTTFIMNSTHVTIISWSTFHYEEDIQICKQTDHKQHVKCVAR